MTGKLRPVPEPSNLHGSHKPAADYGFENGQRVAIHNDKPFDEELEAETDREFKLAIAESISEIQRFCTEVQPHDVARSVGIRFLSTVLVLNPSIFPHGFNSSDLADLLELTKQHISAICTKVKDRFGVEGTFQRSKAVREAYRQGQLKRNRVTATNGNPASKPIPNRQKGNQQ